MPFGYCPTCGRQMQALATSLFCPNDCDRVPIQIDFELTERIIRNRCPKCNSPDTGPFNTWAGPGMHCLDCGTVWQN